MRMQLSPRHRQHTVIILAMLPSLLHLMIALLNHYFHRSFAYYYAVYNFAFFDYAHLRSSPVPILFDGTNSTFIQDHFSLLLPILSPLYWLMFKLTGTYTLMLIQWCMLTAGGWFTFRLIREKCGSHWMALAASWCYFFIYWKFSAHMADCNLAIMGSALVPVFLYFFEAGRTRNWIITFVVLLLVREDFSLWLFFIGVFLAIRHRTHAAIRNQALLVSLISLLFFITLFSWIIPALETPSKPFALFNYGALGEGPAQALAFILKHPWRSLQLLFVNHLLEQQYDGIKTGFYVLFILSGGLLFIVRPHYLVPFIPLFAKKMYNDDPIRWGNETYYGIEFACLMPVLLFLLLKDLNWRRRNLAGFILVCFTIAGTVYSFSNYINMHVFDKMQFYKPDFYRRDYPAEMEKVFSEIPPDAAVTASSRLLPHLAYRPRVYFFPTIKDADYACLSVYGDTWPASPEDYEKKIDELKATGWNVHYASGNVIVLKRGVDK